MKIEIMLDLKSILRSDESIDSWKQKCVKEYDTFMTKFSEKEFYLRQKQKESVKMTLSKNF